MKRLTDEEFERLEQARCAEYQGYLEEFEKWLQASGLKYTTIDEHLGNAYTYLIYYLTREPELGIEESCERIGGYLGNFFIYKCTWSSPAQLKRNAASLKKLYRCLYEKGHVSKASYQRVLDDIKQGLPLWVERCQAYLDEIDNDAYGAPYGAAPGVVPVGAAGAAGANGSPADMLRQMLAEDTTGEFSKEFLKGLADEMAAFPQESVSREDLPDRDEAIEMLYLALLYLSSWGEHDKYTGRSVTKAWPTAGQGTLGALRDFGLVVGGNKNKPLVFTDEGCARAEMILDVMGLGYLLDELDDEAPADVQVGVQVGANASRSKLSFVPEKRG